MIEPKFVWEVAVFCVRFWKKFLVVPKNLTEKKKLDRVPPCLPPGISMRQGHKNCQNRTFSLQYYFKVCFLSLCDILVRIAVVKDLLGLNSNQKILLIFNLHLENIKTLKILQMKGLLHRRLCHLWNIYQKSFLVTLYQNGMESKKEPFSLINEIFRNLAILKDVSILKYSSFLWKKWREGICHLIFSHLIILLSSLFTKFGLLIYQKSLQNHKRLVWFIFLDKIWWLEILE